MGGGNHNESAPGKNVFTLEHSRLCLGGIPESDNWKGCPVGYLSSYDSYNGVGFSQTLEPHDFQAAQSSTPAGTPVSVLFRGQSQDNGQPQLSHVGGLHEAHLVSDQGISQLADVHLSMIGAAGVSSGQGFSVPFSEDDVVEAHRFH